MKGKSAARFAGLILIPLGFAFGVGAFIVFVQNNLARLSALALDAQAAPPQAPLLPLALLSLLVLGAGFALNHEDRTLKALARIFSYCFLSLGAVMMVFPFFWMFSSAFKTSKEVTTFPPVWLPQSPNFDNFFRAFEKAPFERYFLNSLLVTALCVLSTGFTTILAAFAFSRLKFPGRDLLFTLLLSLMMIPFEMLVITNYETIALLKWIDSYPALVFPFLASIFYTYILRNFFLSIPDSLYWSARVDGSGNWRYLWRVMVPIAKPSLVTILLLNAITAWNSFMWPMLVINSTSMRTLPLGLYAFMTEGGMYFELLMAASTLVILPILLLFFFARKKIVAGVSRGGLKG